jgi:flagellar biosynthesis GTPase FlhF
MKIKRFFAPDMRQAIRMVRDEQGPDAVILSTRNTGGGVEIVAAIDYDAELVNGMLGEPQDVHRAAPPATPGSADTGRRMASRRRRRRPKLRRPKLRRTRKRCPRWRSRRFPSC